MDILLIGGAGNVIDALIDKLNKEGHRVYILTGSKYKSGIYKAVYEKYHFEYENDCIKEVFDSIKPDAVIFLGAFDSNFNWKQASKEAVRYSAGLINSLIAFSLLKQGRFIYLSSEEVFSASYPDNISEQEIISAVSIRAAALSQAETVCLNYKQTMNKDIVVLRLDHLVSVPRTKEEAVETCSRMCMEAVSSGKLSVNANNTISLLFLSDAIEYIYKIVKASTTYYSIYHISSSQPINEMQLAQLIKAEVGSEIAIIDNTEGNSKRVVLSNFRFIEEFGMQLFHDENEIVKRISGHMKHHRNIFVDKKDTGRGVLGKLYQRVRYIIHAIIPFVENVACFIPFFMINNRAVGSEYFANLDIYLIYVLLFAIIYGQQQATFSAMLAVAGYCFRQMYNRSGFDVLIDYNTYVWIGHLFILGLVVGYMRDRLNTIKGDSDTEISYLEEQLEDIQNIYSSNVRMKNLLETQLVNQNDSIGKIYEVISVLDKYEPEEIIFHATEVLARLMGSSDVAIYTIENEKYARIVSATSLKARELGNSIQYTEYEDMYANFKQRRVFVNKKLQNKYPLMANAIYSEDDMLLLLMIWGLPWERMTLSQSNMLVVISYLIQNAVVRANRYMEALENTRYLKGTNILDAAAFKSLMKAYVNASMKELTVCCVLEVKIPDGDFERAGALLGKKLRKTDYLGKLEDGKLYALLLNTSVNDADIVIKRLLEAGYSSELIKDVTL